MDTDCFLLVVEINTSLLSASAKCDEWIIKGGHFSISWSNVNMKDRLCHLGLTFWTFSNDQFVKEKKGMLIKRKTFL